MQSSRLARLAAKRRNKIKTTKANRVMTHLRFVPTSRVYDPGRKLYAAMTRTGETAAAITARNREEAKALLIEQYPHLEFYR